MNTTTNANSEQQQQKKKKKKQTRARTHTHILSYPCSVQPGKPQVKQRKQILKRYVRFVQNFTILAHLRYGCRFAMILHYKPNVKTGLIIRTNMPHCETAWHLN